MAPRRPSTATGSASTRSGWPPTAPGWADGRSFQFHRSLAGGPELVWRHLTEPSLLAGWWTPDDLRVSELVFEARPGGRIVQEYRDVEDADGSDVVVGRAEGVVDDVRAGRAPRLPAPPPRCPTAASPSPPTSTSASGRPATGTDLDVRVPDHRQHRRLRRLRRRHRDRLRPEPRQARGDPRRSTDTHRHRHRTQGARSDTSRPAAAGSSPTSPSPSTAATPRRTTRST